MAKPSSPIITGNLDAEFRQLRQKPRTNVILNEANVDGNIPPHLVQAMKRRAQAGSIDRVGQFRYNPFLQATNLDIPSDIKIRHQYMRYFVKTNALVGAAVELHSEFPLSGFHIEHEDPAIQEFLEDMIEETDLVDHVLMAAQEWWTVGEWFSFGFFDDINAPSCWSGFLLLDPDKLIVQTSPWVHGPKKERVSLVVDNLTQKIVEQGPNHPITGAIFRELPTDIIMAAKARRPLELSPLQVSHVKRGSPFAIRGESILERVFPLLMYKDKLRSAQYCWCSATECLTKDGWKKHTELTYKDDIATMNPLTGFLEYQKPQEIIVNDYEGDMIHFESYSHMDMLVTPNHRMWAKPRIYSHSTPTGFGHRPYSYSKYKLDDWQFVEAKDLQVTSKIRAVVNGFEGYIPESTITVGSITYDYIDYLRIVGYYISEGYAESEPATKHRMKTKRVGISQMDYSPHWPEMKNLFEKYGWRISTGTQHIGHIGITDDAQAEHFCSLYGTGRLEKKLPTHIKNLSPIYLEELLRCAVNGDGSRRLRYAKTGATSSNYASISKRLADDIQEIVFKCGYNPNMGGFQGKGVNQKYCHVVYWSDTKDSPRAFPNIVAGSKKFKKYNGKVWCVRVPNGIFVTRRNGRIAIQGNSIADRHISPTEVWKIGESGDPADNEELEAFRELLASTYNDTNRSIIWHHALEYQVEGANGKIMPIWQEMDPLDNEILAGLLLNKSLIMGDSSSFASDVVRYDILINRYLIFRKRVEKWLLRSIFAPILKIHEMYVPEFKVKSRQYRQMSGKGRPLAFPTIKWEKQNLRDDAARVQLLIDLAAKQLVPYSTIYPLLNLDPRQINERIDDEIEENLIRKKKLAEKLAKQGITMPLNPEDAPSFGGSTKLPESIGGGAPSSIGLPSTPGGLGGAANAEGSLPGGAGGGLPNVVPGTEGGATSTLSGGLPGAPVESSLPISIPTA